MRQQLDLVPKHQALGQDVERGPRRPHQHEDPNVAYSVWYRADRVQSICDMVDSTWHTKMRILETFRNPPCLGPWNQKVGSLGVCCRWAPNGDYTPSVC